MSSGLVKFANANIVEKKTKGEAMMREMESMATKSQEAMKGAYPDKTKNKK